jgi:hypothetical protein
MQNVKQSRRNVVVTKGRAKKFDDFAFDLFVRRRNDRRFDRKTKLFEKVLSEAEDQLHVLNAEFFERIAVSILKLVS